ELTQFNEHIYFVMITSLLGVAASRGPFNWRFFILLPANVLTVSFAHMLVYINEAPDDALSDNPTRLNPIATGLISPGAAKKTATLIGLLSVVLYAILGFKPLFFGIISLLLGLFYSFRNFQLKNLIIFDVLSRCLMFAGLQYLCGFFTYASNINHIWFWPFLWVISVGFFREGCHNPHNLRRTNKPHYQPSLPNPENRFRQILIIFMLGFGILSTIITFFLINLIPDWTLFLMTGLSLIFIIPSLLDIKKGAAHQTTFELFRKPIARAIALALLLDELLPWIDNLIGSGIFT
ncbi:MAG: UbiA family prenyltransferase, partial [Chloroflexota bacterium]|nr:UbiA family prenyltransferase [Chloroflexota bacterium]